MPIYTSVDFQSLAKTAALLQQQQWEKTYDKAVANGLIAAWRAFRDNSAVSLTTLGGPRKDKLAGLVADALTYKEACTAARLLLDDAFGTIKMLRDQDLILLDWIRSFRADCLRELEKFLGVKTASDLTAKSESVHRELAALHDKRKAIEAEIVQLEVQSGALVEVTLAGQPSAS